MQAEPGLITMRYLQSKALFSFMLCILCTPLWAQLTPRSISSLDNSLGQPRPLSLNEAFPFFVSESGVGTYEVTWTPAPGHYLYRHAFAFSLQATEDSSAQALTFSLSDGLKKTDQFFGEIEAYYNSASASVSIGADMPETASLIIEYQGCADWGFCYPPQRTTFKLNP